MIYIKVIVERQKENWFIKYLIFDKDSFSKSNALMVE